MKSKSFECPKDPNKKVIQNKTLDFINYYEPAPENGIKLLEKHESDNNNESTSSDKSQVSKREHCPIKKKKKLKDNSVNISKISIDGSNLPHSSKDAPKMTSTPNVKGKKDITENVKSIMKNSSVADDSLDTSTVTVSKNKPKKRNKSVSFMLDESEGIAIKRSKSDLSISDTKSPRNSKIKLSTEIQKKTKKKFVNGKENKADSNNVRVENDTSDNDNVVSIKQKSKTEKMQTSETTDIPMPERENKSKYEKKKHLKQKKTKQVENSPNQEIENAKAEEDKVKKIKKKKRPARQVQEKTEMEGEPVTKSSKKEIKADIIAQDLENLSIGDNAHTLTNLLDEMTVVDNKKKKNKNKISLNRIKKNKQVPNTSCTPTDSSEPKGEEKEKVKWMKRKWNKDKKGGVNDDKLSTSVIIENLPLKIMCSYKKLLTEHFVKFGVIKLVGIAEVYSIEHPQVFTTTINFDSEDAANKALEEDNTLFEGNRIRVKRPLPPSQTTLVVRSYADLSETALSSVFTSAGRIRNVRRLVKGKKSMGTAFIEFDGPEAVIRAIKMAEDVKIGGKKIFAAKFEVRNTNRTKKLKRDREAENDAGSDGSSD